MQILHAAQLFFPAFVNAVGWTLIHSLWQGGLAAIVTLLILSITKRSSAVTRYNLLLFVFAIFICSVIVTFLHESSIIHSDRTDQVISSSADLSATSVHETSFRVVEQTNWLLVHFKNYFNAYGGFLVAVWFIFFCFHCMKFGIGLGHIYHIRHVGTNFPSPEFQDRCNDLKKKLFIRINVSLIESTRVRVPVVIGFIKPMILVPVGLLASLPYYQVESILLHELAHIRRGDFLVNLVQSITETIFFFNPAVRWISSLIKEEREACCDDLAIQKLGSKAQYVEALVSFRLNDALPLTGNALAFPGDKKYLLERVKRIISNENKKLGFMEKSILFSGLLAIMLVNSLVNAQGKEQKENIPAVNRVIPAVTDTVPVKITPAQPVEPVEPSENSDIREGKEDQQKIIDQSEINQKKLKKEIEEASKYQQKEIRKKLHEASLMQNQKQVELQALIAAQQEEIKKSQAEVFINQAELLKKMSLEDAGDHIDKNELLALLKEKQSELEEIHAETAMARVEAQQKIMESNQILMEKVNLGKLRMLANRGGNEQVDEILDALMENDVIKKIEGTSFTLNNKELVVNGVRQSESLHNELKDKFIDNKEDYISYSSKKGSVSITLHHKD